MYASFLAQLCSISSLSSKSSHPCPSAAAGCAFRRCRARGSTRPEQQPDVIGEREADGRGEVNPTEDQAQQRRGRNGADPAPLHLGQQFAPGIGVIGPAVQAQQLAVAQRQIGGIEGRPLTRS